MKFIIPIIFLLFLTGCNEDKKIEKKQEIDEEATLSVNYDAPFSIEFSDNSKLFIKRDGEKFEFKGLNEPVLFFFFTTWCPPCNAQIDILKSIASKYKNLKVYGILVDDKISIDDLNEFIKENKINFKIANSGGDFFAKSLGGIANIPYMILFNKNGVILEKYLGVIPSEMLENDLERMLNV